MSKLILQHLSSPLQGETIEFTKPTISIGRAEGNDLIFQTGAVEMVSRRHAEISFQNGRFTIQDNSSTGTYLNDEKIQKASLKINDVLRFGSDGPELLVRAMISSEKATVVFSSPAEEKIVPDEDMTLAADEPKEPLMKATVIAAESERKPSPIPMPAAGSVPRSESSYRPPSGPAHSPVASAKNREVSGQGNFLPYLVYANSAILLIFLIFFLVRYTRLSNQWNDMEVRLSKVDSALAQILGKLGAADGGEEAGKILQSKTAEINNRIRQMEQRAAQMEQRARETEERFQSMFDRKTAEMNHKFAVLEEAYPQVKRKMQEVERKSGRR